MMGRAYTQDRQGNTPGQLGCMDACVSSPPYIRSLETKGGIDPGKSEHTGGPHSQMNRSDTRYGDENGQLAVFLEGSFEGVVSSPPWETQNACNDPKYQEGRYTAGGPLYGDYGETSGQLGQETAETFWSAAKTIVEQTYDLLVPGGHAIWVVKRFVRNKKIVEFSQMWAQLCESVGFQLFHWHRAWLVEDRGTQLDLFGNEHHKTIKRASFFRRLYEKKYPENAIDWEDVICLVK